MAIGKIVIALSLCFTIIAAKSSLTTRNDATPKGCKWQHVSVDSAENSKHLLSCKLRTISGLENLLGNFSVYQTERISSLKLECSDVLFYESSLEGSQHSGSVLENLRNLQELNIEFCKIRFVPSMVLRGLRDLRSLSLRTHNTDWSTMNLELHPESFRGLTELTKLDLADNNIWSLPTDVFCPLFSLKTLNLTKNRLTDMRQLGFSDWSSEPNILGKTCNPDLQHLDLSYNHIVNFPNSGFSALKTLTLLNLQENSLTSLADKSFAGLHSLKILNISSNQLITIPPELFKSTRALTQLYLQNNTLTVVAPGLIEGLDRLEVLDLSQNKLTSTWINRDTFTGLKRLVVLNLGFNQLSKIDGRVFHDLFNLQILNLEYNAIETIANNAFMDLKNLHSLSLSHNKLKRIEAYYLSDLRALTQLFLESNEIVDIDTVAFENLTNLNDLCLNDNLLSDIPDAIRKLSSLRSLDVGKNKIRTVRNSSFVGLDELFGLRLVDNFLTKIPRDTFKALTKIRVLNLASNQINHIDQSAFNSNPTVRAIRLDDNELEDMSGLFASLPALVWLNVSDNRIRWFDYGHLPVSLEWLDMHKNNISDLSNYYEVRNDLQLKMLDASYNSLNRLSDTSIPDNIETLFVNNNNIGDVAPGTFMQKKFIEKVVLYGNNIRKLDISALALYPVNESRVMPEFYLGNNPIHCDCHMEWLQRINELSHLRQHPRVLDLDLVMCTMEHDRIEAVRPLMDLRTQEFLCRYVGHCFALCHCCDFDACDCKMTCPDRCNCYHDHTWNTNVVDCGNAEYTNVPERIPMDATAIYLDGNNLGDLGSHMFIGKKKLELLFLNDSQVSSLHNRTFNGVSSLKVLHIENNHIAELRGYEFDQLTNLSELYLDRNDISFIGDRTFEQLKVLEVLTLSDNKIINFVPWQHLSAASASGTLSRVTLRGTKWKCNCESVLQLQEWIKDISGEFDINQMICLDDRIVGEVIKACDDINTYSSYVTPTVQRNVLMGNTLIGGGYVPILAAILVSIIGAALLIALACIFRQDVRLWAHAKYGVRLFKDRTNVACESEEIEKLYDAYILNSIRDTDCSAQIIASELNRSGYNLCLRHRDIHSATLFNDLQNATDVSKKIVLIVSINFLQFEWCQPQFRQALQTVIENIRPAHRSHKIVLILTAPIEVINIDPVMQILTQTCPTICWGEKRFWDKLRFALPDIPQKSMAKKMGNVSSSPNLRYTPAPSTLDSWCKNHQRSGIPVVLDHQQNIQFQSSHTEDGSSSCASSHYEIPPIQNYVCRSTASSLGHVYSTIPETPQLGRSEQAYFV